MDKKIISISFRDVFLSNGNNLKRIGRLFLPERKRLESLAGQENLRNFAAETYFDGQKQQDYGIMVWQGE